MRNASHTVLQEKALALSRGTEILIRGKGTQDLFRHSLIFLTLPSLCITAELHIGGSHYGCGRGISICIRYLRIIEVPICHSVLRKMAENHVTDIEGLLQIFPTAGLAVHHGISVESPCLASRPGGVVRIALNRVLAPHATIRIHIVHKMPCGVVLAEMVGHGRVGMILSNTVQRVAGKHLRGDSVMFLMTIVFIAVAILSLIASRLLMYHIKKYFDINYLEYILWCTLEIVTICGLYTGITMSIDLPAGETILKVFGRSLLYGTIALGVPYLISGMYFAIIDKNNTIRLMSYENVVTDEPVKPESQMSKITLFDNSGSLKLSLNPDSLYYIESDDNYIKVWYTDSKGELKQYMLRCRLKTVEESFKGVGLVRCNRKYIVNINKVATLRKESEGYILDLANEAIQPLPVTKTYTDNVLSYFTEVQPLLDPIEE